MKQDADNGLWVKVDNDWTESDWATLNHELEANGLWARRHGDMVFIPNVRSGIIGGCLTPDLVMAAVLDGVGED